MFAAATDVVITGIKACFGWFSQIMDAMPGAWSTIFTLFTIFVICRFLLGPVLGAAFSGSSDRAKIKAMKHQNKLKDAARK